MTRRRRKVEANAIQLAARHGAESTAYIYRLPNELLHLIFTFLFASRDESTPFQPGPRGPVYVKPVLVMRWVCAWFRKIATHHSTWLHSNYFDLEESVPCRYVPPLRSREFIETREEFLYFLLEDDDICNCLRRTTGWRFSAFVDFLVVTNKMPSLVSNARKVSIENIDINLAILVRGLRGFTSLTSLDIDFDTHRGFDRTVDLGTIARSCPLLEEITLLGLNSFRGSLAPLQHVKRVCIMAPRAGHIKDIPHLSSLVPINSAHCLTTLKFHTPTNWGDLHKTTSNPFDPFAKLTTLEIEPLSSLIFDFIADSKLSLLDFTILFYQDWHSEALFRTLSATSLKFLRKLKVTRCDDYWFDDSHFEAIARLEYLEHLDLEIEIPRVWWLRLAYLRRLNYLCGIADEEERDEGEVDEGEMDEGEMDEGGIDEEEVNYATLQALALVVKFVGEFSLVRIWGKHMIRKKLHCYRGSVPEPKASDSWSFY
jgi:hypothetical protein